MPTRRTYLDPIGNYNFLVDGISSGTFTGVDGLSYEVEMIEYRDAENPTIPRYRPGLPKGTRITLKRGFLTAVDMNKWIEDIAAGTYERKDATIQLNDNIGNVVASWNLFGCMPTKWSLNGFDGKSNDLAYETIEFVVEEVVRVEKSSDAPEGPKDAGFWEKVGGAVAGSTGAALGGALDGAGGLDGNSGTMW